MKHSLLSLSRLAVAGFSILAASVRAGTFFSDFESGLPAGTAVYGNAIVDTSGGVDNNGGVLKLTTATTVQQGAFIINDLDPGLRVGSFLVTFKLQLGGGTAVPADGFSFNFGAGLNGFMNEEGSGTGITVTFDTFDNGTGDAQEGPEIRVKNNGSVIASRKILGEFKTGANYVDVLLRYNISGTMDIVFNNQVMFTNTYISGTPGAGSQFGFGARTGGNTENHFIDNLNITTVPAGHFYLKGGTLPSLPLAATPDATFQTVLNDLSAAVLTNGITMYFNGEQVSPTISKPGGITTITYDPPGWLLPGSSNSVTVIAADSSGGIPATLSYNFNVTNGPLWSLPPHSRSYLTVETASSGNAPFQRTIAYNALSNQLYLVDHSAFAIYALDATTGADLYQFNITGIPTTALSLVSLAVADDGAVYGVGVSTTNSATIYRWANASSSTAPVTVFTGAVSASSPSNTRWGDTLAARGSGTNTQLILDAYNFTYVAVLTPTDSTMAHFTSTAYSHSYANASGANPPVGRSLQFGPTNTFWMKKRAQLNITTQMPLDLISFNGDLSTTLLSSVADYHPQLGNLAVDMSKNMAAGIFFATNSTSYDRLVVYDLAAVTNPLQVATYNMPTNHQANINMIGKVVFGPDKIFVVEGSTGLMAVPAFAPAPPKLTVTPSGSNVVVSWPNAVPGFVLQGSGDAGLSSGWANLNLPVKTNLAGYSVTDAAGTNAFYRLVK